MTVYSGVQIIETERGWGQAVLHCFIGPHPHPWPSCYSTSSSGSYSTAPDRTNHLCLPPPGPSQPQHSPSARAEAPELLLPGLAWSGGATAPTVSRQAPFTLLPATGTINPTRQGREGGGRRKANPARRAGIRPGCALGALKTKNQGQARTPNATLTHTDIHDSVCGNAGRRHACLVTSLPGSVPGICNWRARPKSVFSSAPELRVPWFLARRRALWTCERARRVGARC